MSVIQSAVNNTDRSKANDSLVQYCPEISTYAKTITKIICKRPKIYLKASSH